jgi:hypothetical protein
VCRHLREFQNAIVSYAGNFDASAVTPAQAGQVVKLCAQIESSVASIKALAAARSAEGNDWKQAGYRSPEDQLARQTGSSPANAKRTLQAGRRLAQQPKVAKEALAGELSLEQAAAVAMAAEAKPEATDDLIEKAKRFSVPELNTEVTRIKANEDDQEARRQRRHARRSIRHWTDEDGTYHAHVDGHPEDGALLSQVLDPIKRRLNALGHAAGTPQPLAALDYDSLMTLAQVAIGHDDGQVGLADLLGLGLFPQLDDALQDRHRPTSTSPDPAAPPPDGAPKLHPKKLAGSPIKVIVRIDLAAFVRGMPLDGELCEIAGYGPVPVSVVEEFLATKNPFIVGLISKGEDLTTGFHFGRHPSALQRSALEFLSPTCTVEGCSAKTGLQFDHRHDYSVTGITAFSDLDRLCGHHHSLKTNHGWALVEGRGKRSFVRPADERHPRQRVGTTSAGAGPP